jgi:RHS repeat-associated protein
MKARKILLCEYRYDALDQLIGHIPANQAPHQRFYCKSRLATEIQGATCHSIFQHGDLLLGQQQREDDVLDNTLLATDRQRSVLHTIKKDNLHQPIAYAPYGYRRPGSGLLSLMGFNGERSDPVTGHYSLGNGYRVFSTVLMRFNSPDSWSPFGDGGLNAYAYCTNDPCNKYDPDGHSAWLFGLEQGLEVLNRKIARPFLSPPRHKNPAMRTMAKKTTSKRLESTLDKFSTLKNESAEYLSIELAKHQSIQKNQKGQTNSLIKPISTQSDLNELKSNTRYKFVFTKNSELLTGAPAKSKIYGTNRKVWNHMSHAVITESASSQKVISAGYLNIESPGNISITNTSGHYKPPFETLAPVRSFLEGLGAQVNTIRHTS